MNINPKEIFKWAFAILGLFGFAGIAVFWNNISKPWINFSISSVRYNSNLYQEIYLRNTSKNLNLQAELEIPIKRIEKIEKQVENSFSSGRYVLGEDNIKVFLGKEQGVDLTCMDCKINKASIKNLVPENFSLRECSMIDTNCMYESKFTKFLSSSIYWWPLLMLAFYLLSLYYKKLPEIKKDSLSDKESSSYFA